jgi:hypothetical protein
MSDISRRDALRRIGLAVAAAGMIDRVSAQEVHHLASQATTASGGAYSPSALSEHEYRTLERLTDLIIPMENGAPGALAAGAPAWIDMLAGANEQLKRIYTTGLLWIDEAARQRGADTFLSASAAQQTALLDQLAYRRNQTSELAPGIQFFTWVRRMTVDAFYTSEIGIHDIDYRGNTALAAYPEPIEAITFALKKSNLQ